MKKFSGKKISAAVFISGRGSNLKNLINFSYKKKSPIVIDFVFTNNIKAYGLRYAYEKKIKVYYFKNKNFSISETKILKILKKKKIMLICLAGFMKILSNNFIKKFNGKIINIHPSLLPQYKGLKTHQRVLKNKENYTGCTVHFVNSKLDSGKIILQKKVKIYKNDKEKNLEKRVLREEHKLYPKAIIKIFS